MGIASRTPRTGARSMAQVTHYAVYLVLFTLLVSIPALALEDDASAHEVSTKSNWKSSNLVKIYDHAAKQRPAIHKEALKKEGPLKEKAAKKSFAEAKKMKKMAEKRAKIFEANKVAAEKAKLKKEKKLAKAAQANKKALKAKEKAHSPGVPHPAKMKPKINQEALNKAKSKIKAQKAALKKVIQQSEAAVSEARSKLAK